MSQRQKHGARRFVAATVLLLTLLVVLVPASHHSTALMALPVLATVFLFGIIKVPLSLWPVSPLSEARPLQSPDLPSRFQRPPPATL
jgi:hypothetical protein